MGWCVNVGVSKQCVEGVFGILSKWLVNHPFFKQIVHAIDNKMQWFLNDPSTHQPTTRWRTHPLDIAQIICVWVEFDPHSLTKLRIHRSDITTYRNIQQQHTYKTWILSVCLCVRVFQSHQKSQGHEILALGLIWANVDHYEARFSKFWFLRILWAFFVFFQMGVFMFFFFKNLSHFNKKWHQKNPKKFNF